MGTNPVIAAERFPLQSYRLLLAPLNEGRGMHPGNDGSTSTGALQGPPSLNEGRGMHPGNDTSARRCRQWPPRTALNEGRGMHPSNDRLIDFTEP